MIFRLSYSRTNQKFFYIDLDSSQLYKHTLLNPFYRIFPIIMCPSPWLLPLDLVTNSAQLLLHSIIPNPKTFETCKSRIRKFIFFEKIFRRIFQNFCQLLSANVWRFICLICLLSCQQNFQVFISMMGGGWGEFLNTNTHTHNIV